MKVLGFFNHSNCMVRGFKTSTPKKFKVTVVGASGGIGQPLSLLFKLCPLINELSLHDLDHTHGVNADLSHINTPTKVNSFTEAPNMGRAMQGAQIVVVPAGSPRKPGMTRDDLFNVNANVVYNVAIACATSAPEAFLVVITNPVNTVVPIACYVYEKLKKGNPNRILGVTTLDVLRTNTFIAELKGLDVNTVDCPCVGGHAGDSIIPLLSQCNPKVNFTEEEIKKLTFDIQEAGNEVMKAKKGRGTSTLSIAYASYKFVLNILKALKGEPNIHECTYIKNNINAAPFFSSILLFGKNGIEKNLGIPSTISEFEKKQIEACIKTVTVNAKRGKDYVDSKP